MVTDGIALEEAKTKLLASQLKALALDDVLIMVEATDEKLTLAARNLPHVEVLGGDGDQPGERWPPRQGAGDRRCGEADRGAPAMTATRKPLGREQLMSVLLAPHVTEKTSLGHAGAQSVHLPRAPRCHQHRHAQARWS